MASLQAQEEIQKLMGEVASLRVQLWEKDATINKLDTKIAELGSTINKLTGLLSSD